MLTLPSDATLTRLDEMIAAYCEERQIFGILRITIGNKIVFQKSMGYENLETMRPFSECSMFSLYSISKAFCVFGLLKLYDQGLLDLDRHPAYYLSEAKGLDARITLRHLLLHESGLPDFELDADFAEQHRPGYAHHIRGHLSELTKWPQHFAPGTQMMYANVNMVIPALIIENLCKKSYAEYMKEEIFAPLGMMHAAVDNENLSIENRVQGYALLNGIPTPIEKSHDWMLGAGDIIGTVDDVYALRHAIKHRPLLKESTWRELLTPSAHSDFGMGCRLSPWYNKSCITHTGGHLGFRTLHRYLPEDDFDLIFLSCSGYGTARIDLGDLIHTAFYKSSPKSETQSFMQMDKGYI